MHKNNMQLIQVVGGVFIVGILAIFGLLYFSEIQNSSNGNSQRSEKRESRMEDENDNDEDETAGINSFATINTALASFSNVVCVFDDEDEKTTVYIKDGALRADMTGDDDDENAGIIYSGNNVSIWNTKSKTGMVFDATKTPLDEVEDAIDKISEDSLSDIMEQALENKEMCQSRETPDSFFTAPAGIQFSFV